MRAIDHGKPIETRMRQSMRTIQDFEDPQKLGLDANKPPFNERYKANRNVRARTKGGFKNDQKMQKVLDHDDAWQQRKTIQVLEKGNPRLIEDKMMVSPLLCLPDFENLNKS